MKQKQDFSKDVRNVLLGHGDDNGKGKQIEIL